MTIRLERSNRRMKRQLPMWTIVLTLISCGQCLGGDGGESDAAPRRHLFQRARPVGGWNPYGGGVFHWWNPHCFPCQSAPDDYCRKPLPKSVLAGIPSLLHCGTAGDRLSPEQWPPGLRQAALKRKLLDDDATGTSESVAD